MYPRGRQRETELDVLLNMKFTATVAVKLFSNGYNIHTKIVHPLTGNIPEQQTNSQPMLYNVHTYIN